MESASTQSDTGQASGAPVKRSVRWHRRTLARFGLQGKLLVCFMCLLTAALAGSCWLFASGSRDELTRVIGEQAGRTSYMLALAARPVLNAGHKNELNRIGQDLLKGRDILFIAFFDADGHPLSLAGRDPDLRSDQLGPFAGGWGSGGHIRRKNSAVFGDYIEAIAPILNISSSGATSDSGGSDLHSRVLGHVAVGMSEVHEMQRLREINYSVVLVGCVLVLLSLPLAYALVHRIFYPIRQLVEATRSIAGGRLDTQVAIERPDMIGTLARSFNEMVRRVKKQRDQLEEANTRLAEANATLETRVRRRTAQLETANRRLSGEIAEKEDFLRAVSHDLNAPLRNIIGMAAMLLAKNRDRLDEAIIHRLERIRGNAETQTELISDLLDVSRLKTRRQKREMVELDALVRELGLLFENDLRTRGISLVLDNMLPVLRCERGRLRQVFQNLIDNAIKYMGEGPIRQIHIGWQESRGEAVFYVRDTGMGIEARDLGEIFLIFRRGHNEVARKIAGKGVGLASVKIIVETYGGSIRAESEIGRGSTFYFSINGRFLRSGLPQAPLLASVD